MSVFFEKLALVGVGLIGSSIAQGVRNKGLVGHSKKSLVTGY